MLATGLLQEHTTTATDISWLVWVVLALFLVMVLLGWWASGRLPQEDETILMTENAEAHGGHGDVVVNHEEQ